MPRHPLIPLEVNDESGPTFEVVVVVEGGDGRRTLLVSADERIVGERHWRAGRDDLP